MTAASDRAAPPRPATTRGRRTASAPDQPAAPGEGTASEPDTTSVPDAEAHLFADPGRRGLLIDTGIASGLFIAAVISLALSVVSGIYFGDEGTEPIALAASALITLPLALRRRHPVTVALVVCGAYFVAGSMLAVELYVSQVAMFIAIYTIGRWVENRRRAALSRAFITAGMLLWLLVHTYIGATDPESLDGSFAGSMTPYLAYMLMQWLINIAYFGGACYMGNRGYVAAREHAILQQRTRELEEERELTAAQAVALDRVRIARELHDVVAHHVSAMGVQAGAARTVLDHDAAASKRALATVEESARSAIAELHHLLDTLRSPDSDPDFATGAPSTLRLDRLDSLAEAMSASGTPTRLIIVGEPQTIPEIVQVNLYRIAQEALTNARRHGGPDATAEVRVRYQQDAVEIEVTNTGRAALDARPGLGQLGMRERAIASGGALELRARARGGYLVRVSVPLALRAVDDAARGEEAVA